MLAPTALGLLAAVEAYYGGRGVDLPERRIPVPGAPGVVAWDCEQVTVCLGAVATPGTPSGGGGPITPQLGSVAGMGLVRLATWAVCIVRCTPTMGDDGEPPPAEELGAAGLAMLDDVGLLSQCMSLLAGSPPGSYDWLPIGGTINAGSVTTLGPEGRFAAVEASVTISAMEALP